MKNTSVFSHARAALAGATLLVGAQALATIYVAPEGDDTNDGASWKSPVKTIYKAITLTTVWHEVIYVSNGVYRLTEPVVFTGTQGAGRTGTYVRGWSGDPRDVVFDGGNATQGFTYTGGYNYYYENITVQNCRHAGDGAGIRNCSGGHVKNCIISNCVSTAGNGGGLNTYYCDGGVKNTLVIDCSAKNGGGVYLFGTVMSGCTVTNCTAQYGGGVYLWSDSPTTPTYMTNTTVACCSAYAENAHTFGGGVFANGNVTHYSGNPCLRSHLTDCTIENCTVSNKVTNTSVYQHRGGGVALQNADLYDSRVRGCRLYSDGDGYYDRANGGGICAWGKQPVVSGCTVCSNATYQLISKPKGDGGGISMFESGMVTNCHVFANHACFGGGGVHIKAASKLVDCTITDNWITNMLYTGSSFGGAGVRVAAGTGALVARCVIANNHDYKTGVYNGSGGALLLSGTDTLVTDCIITNNVGCGTATCPALVRFGSTSDGAARNNVISNCYIAGNTGSGPLFATYHTDGQSVVDCVIEDNTTVNYLIAYFYSDAYAAPNGFNFRNTLFRNNKATGNKSSGIFGTNYTDDGKGNPVDAKFHFDHCTFVGNRTGYELMYVRFSDDRTRNTAGNTFVDGCLFYDNGANDFDGDMKTYAPNNVTCTRASNVATTEGLHNFGGSVDPLFVDAANGDYRLTEASPLVDQGVAAAWMGTGVAKKPPFDLGTGTPVVKASADWGVKVAWAKAHQRLCNGKPDLGCFEFVPKPGLLLLYR